MKKLRLQPEDLAVESFDTAGDRTDPGGTVRAHQQSNRFTFCWTQPEHGYTCLPAYTCPECAYTLDPCPDETLACP
jgi:hypothetical protein